MRKQIINWVLAVVALGIGSLAIYELLRIPEAPPRVERGPADEAPDSTPGIEAVNARFVYSDSAQIKAILEANRVTERMQDRRLLRQFNEGFQVEFFAPDGEVASLLMADTGQIDMESGTGTAWGNVRIYADESEQQVNTERLFWNRGKKQIWNYDQTFICTPQELLIGDSVLADSNFMYFYLKDIKGSIYLNEGL